MFQIYGRAANRFGRQQNHWVTMQASLCLCSDAYVPDLAWDDGTVDIHAQICYTLMNKTITGDGWCAADQVTFEPFVLTRPVQQAVIIQPPPTGTTGWLPCFHIGFPIVLPDARPRPLTLLLGTSKPGWFRL